MNDEPLAREANQVHRALFGIDAPVELGQQYARVLATAPLAEWPVRLDLEAIARRGGDLEAIEFALRRQRPRNALTQRFQVVAYLAEVRPEHFNTFVNEDRHTLRGYLVLAVHLLRSTYKLLKGRLQIRRHAIG